ncbi:hypothetical protein BX264_6368 [Streptomyces sp. 2333.5]|nr:hypothetical protein BX264_6368 [Streptomyces sp. 2333.5]SEE86514.1 hypothetical protein SAMN05428943_6468 [Streptomyces sp. 2314.4]SEF04992.1 hypothetical protein SAMN05428942_6466 [Streptomyces sp. 2112.2]
MSPWTNFWTVPTRRHNTGRGWPDAQDGRSLEPRCTASFQVANPGCGAAMWLVVGLRSLTAQPRPGYFIADGLLYATTATWRTPLAGAAGDPSPTLRLPGGLREPGYVIRRRVAARVPGAPLTSRAESDVEPSLRSSVRAPIAYVIAGSSHGFPSPGRHPHQLPRRRHRGPQQHGHVLPPRRAPADMGGHLPLGTRRQPAFRCWWPIRDRTKSCGSRVSPVTTRDPARSGVPNSGGGASWHTRGR